jgi:signal transduction histidine kinase
MASLGRLASGMAHEINNPITSVLNNLAVLHRDTEGVLAILDVYRQGIGALGECAPELASEARRLEREKDLAFFYNNLGKITDGMRKGLMRIRNIVHNLADFAHLDEAERKEVDVNASLTSVVQILQHDLSEKDLRLDADFQPLPTLWGQPSKLNQVFLNLLVNAIQACQPQGTISLRTRAEDGWVVVEIEDNGVGIAVADLPHIFEPFFTTKPVGEGTGLGLAVSYGIVRDHGGLIAASSELGKGSTFCVRLPVVDSRPHKEAS